MSSAYIISVLLICCSLWMNKLTVKVNVQVPKLVCLWFCFFSGSSSRGEARKLSWLHCLSGLCCWRNWGGDRQKLCNQVPRPRSGAQAGLSGSSRASEPAHQSTAKPHSGALWALHCSSELGQHWASLSSVLQSGLEHFAGLLHLHFKVKIKLI